MARVAERKAPRAILTSTDATDDLILDLATRLTPLFGGLCGQRLYSRDRSLDICALEVTNPIGRLI